jgi:hypothetical protein
MREVVSTPKKKPHPGNISPGSTIEPLLLDIHAAARALSTTVWAIRSFLWADEIPHIRIGRKFLIDPADLRAYVACQKDEAA